jgi:hypothetical protein
MMGLLSVLSLKIRKSQKPSKIEVFRAYKYITYITFWAKNDWNITEKQDYHNTYQNVYWINSSPGQQDDK